MRTPAGQKALGAILLDVTEQETTKEALRISEERLRLAIRGGAVGMWDWQGGGTILLSEGICTFLGLEAEGEETAVPASAIIERIHDDDVALVAQSVSELMARGDGEFRVEIRVPAGEDEVNWLLLVGQFHSGGSGPRMLGVAINITETKRAEETVRRAQEELERRVELRTRQLAVTNARLRHEVDERRQAETQLEEIRRLLARGQEAERIRLAHELHDGPMQELATLGFELTRTMRMMDEAAAAQIASIRDRLPRRQPDPAQLCGRPAPAPARYIWRRGCH